MKHSKLDLKMILIIGMTAIIIALISVILGRNRSPEDLKKTSPRNIVAEKEKEIPPPPPDIIRIRKQEGKKYRTSSVGQIRGEALNRNWGLSTVQHFLYRWEVIYDSEIIRNDGRYIKEKRRFLANKTWLIVAPREINISTKWIMAVEVGGRYLGYDGFGKFVKLAELGINTLLSLGPSVDDMQVKWKSHSLEGKTVVLTLPDTMKEHDVKVEGNMLTQEEIEMLRDASLLMDARTLPKENMEQGESWTVPASELAMCFDPDMGGKIGGIVTLTRQKDQPGADATIAPLHLDMDVTVRDQQKGNAVVGRFIANGNGQFNKSSGVLEHAQLDGKADYQKVSTDHLLFEARQEYKPKLTIEYRCFSWDDPSIESIRGKNVSMDKYLNDLNDVM